MRSKNLALALLATAQFVVVLDASIVNVALPSIGRDLNFAEHDLSWVVNAYTLVFGGFLLLGGRLADLLGRRRIFVWGMWLFAVASLAGGLAQSDVWLVVARAVQGLGAALISPAALSILATTFAEGAERNKALAVWGAVAGSGGAVGVLAGGMLTQWAGWEWVLFVNTPIGIAAALIAPRIFDESRDESNPSWDVAGAVAVTAGLALLVYTLVDANDAGWGSTQTIGLGALSVVLLASFVFIELRRRYPLIPFSIFKLRTLRGSNVIGLLLGMSLFAMFFFISLYMQQVLGYDPLKAGLAYLPLAGLIIVSAGGASQLVARFGFKPVLIPEMLAAVGLGLSFVPVTIGSVTGTKPSEAGLASGLINTSQQVGGALGLAILSTIATNRTQAVLDSGVHDPKIAFTEGFQNAFLAGGLIALVGALLALVLISSADSRQMAEEAEAGASPAVPA